ncbi:ATP-binding protein [Steroidobacter sp.]|uniref:hybrid sensor histidine kinase/response regulator n=1 Tax=Steroidobacter sp. TaxID=1978227 RepID=UPI001A3C73FE|nr:ATP-binding protein [Steroidobacter sp.]MBL8266055.1 PAS domain S-box protein [Steroidobacter sp.]
MDQLSDITQHLLRFSPDALIVVDAAGCIRFANHTVTELFGYEPEQLLDKPLETLIPERLRGKHVSHLTGFLSRPGNREMGARIADLFARRADGSEFAAGIRLAPFKIGGTLFVAAAIRDNTERQKINEALIAAREDADRANRAKSRFLATASHDLRQPIQTIRLLNAAMLKISRPDLRELLQQQERAIEGMTRMLNALLDISRLESGAIEPQISNVPLTDVLHQLTTEFESVAQARGIAFRIEPAALVVSTDRTLFYQLLQNLVGNALKYTDQGEVSVLCAPGSSALTITVSDSGIGIPADKLDRIFDEYYQVDTQGAKRMGVGLGLAIVKEVARLLGFSVSITSRVGEGTRATVSIPNQYLMAMPAGADVTSTVEPVGGITRRSRVLLVEDNDGVRLATELFLRFEGFHVESAASAAEAEVLFERFQRGDVIVADYHLDGRNTGLELLTRLRQRIGFEVPGVVLSGDLPSVLRSLRSPVPNCRFLSKPVDTAALLDAIDELSAEAGGTLRSAAGGTG